MVPAYNEEARLPATLSKILSYLEGGAHSFAEVIVVDDGSADGTARVVREFHQRHPSIRLLSNPGNRGKVRLHCRRTYKEPGTLLWVKGSIRHLGKRTLMSVRLWWVATDSNGRGLVIEQSLGVTAVLCNLPLNR